MPSKIDDLKGDYIMEIKKIAMFGMLAALIAIPGTKTLACEGTYTESFLPYNSGSYTGSFTSYVYGWVSSWPGGHFSNMNSRYERSHSATWVSGIGENASSAPAGQWAYSAVSEQGIDNFRHRHTVGGIKIDG